MADKIAAHALKGLLEGAAPFALIDVREAGEYNSSHIPGASLIARRQLELSIKHAVPLTDTHAVLCDDDGRRAPEEVRRFCIPGGRSVPGGELSLRITDIAKKLDRDTTIIVNCAGRTRSIIGTRVLQRMGIPNVYGLKNGTAGWVLAGHKLE